jgi:hypothetical protein
MAIASNNVLVLLRWDKKDISIVDSMLMPEISQGDLSDIAFVGGNICLKFRV